MENLPRPRLLLIDGYALIYRAFFAMISRPLTTGKGENTSAAWGVANFLLRIRDEYRPDYVVWVNDAGSSFRKETYPEYKATREKLDAELQDTLDRSMERIQQLLDASGILTVAIDGYEADDVIGTLATQAGEAGMHAVIVSGDKDFYQLIGPNVSLLNPGRGGPAAVREELVTLDNATDRLGVEPHRVVDYLALVGDASDNVPGVRGVGDKTARQLLGTFGDLDTVLERAGEISGKRAREALLAEADRARLSRELVTIRRDVPVDLDPDGMRFGGGDPAALRSLFSELEFHTLVDLAGGAAEAPPESQANIVSHVDQLGDVVAAVRETGIASITSHGPFGDARTASLVGLAIAADVGRAWYVPLGHRPPDGELLSDAAPENLPALTQAAMKPLVDLLQDESIAKAGHDLKTDWLRLRTAGIELRGASYDVLLASFLLDPGKRSHELGVLGLEQIGLRFPSHADVVGKGKSRRPFAEISVDRAAEYACARAACVLALREHLAPQLHAAGLSRLLDEVESPLIRVLVDMQWTGIRLDTERLVGLSTQFRAQASQLQDEIFHEAGTDFNLNSTPQLRHILFEKLQLPVIKRTKTGPSTDADVLAQLAASGFEVPKLLLRYRELAKLQSTYVDALPRSVNPHTERVHTTFHQTGAATGRLSSSDPNLQNIPVRTERGGEIRRCFVPTPGFSFIVADYSQIELRLLAHLSDDAAFIDAFERGGDIHRETAGIIFDVAATDVTSEMRGRAKTINFATIYGQGAFALARQLEISQDEAKDFITRYFERFSGVRRFLDESIERARERGYAETLFGRRRYIPELREKSFNIRAFGERTAMNSPIQGSAADLIKIAMIDLDHALRDGGYRASILLQVHDELVLEAAVSDVGAVSEIVRGAMTSAAELKVPLVVDVGVGPNWLDAKQ